MSACWNGGPRPLTRTDKAVEALDDDVDEVIGGLERVAEVLGGVILVLLMIYALAGWITQPDWNEPQRPELLEPLR